MAGSHFAFQSQNGSIKSRLKMVHNIGDGHFNPKMVRLRGKSKPNSDLLYIYFNPKMVRLRVIVSWEFSESVRISIPKWFD